MKHLSCLIIFLLTHSVAFSNNINPKKRGAERQAGPSFTKRKKIEHFVDQDIGLELNDDQGFVTDEDEPEAWSNDFEYDPLEDGIKISSSKTKRPSLAGRGYLKWQVLYDIFDLNWPELPCGEASFTVARDKDSRFSLSYDQIRIPVLYKFLADILRNDNHIFVDKNNYISHEGFNYSVSFIRYLFENIPGICEADESLEGKEKEIESLVIHLFSLRLAKEIHHHKLPLCCNKATNWEEELRDDFQDICDYEGNYQKELSPERIKEYFGSKRQPNKGAGGKCSNHFMHDHRVRVKKATKNFSPVDEYNSFNLVRNIASIIKKEINKDTGITSKKLYSEICRNNSAAQFRPTYLKDILLFLKNIHRIEVQSILDLSAGWFDRGLASLASTSQGLRRYIGTDPNTSLQKPYVDICHQFIPPGFNITSTNSDQDNGINILYKREDGEIVDNFQMILYPHPMENLSPEQLCPDGKKSDLMFTSIPYFDQEQYEGENQSWKTYPTYEKWKKGFLQVLIEQAVMGVKIGGVIAINSAPINKNGGKITYDITHDLEQYLNKYANKHVRLKRLSNFWYDGKPPSKTLIYKVIAK